MTSMPKCGALRDAAGGWDWVQMMSLYCEGCAADGRNFAGRLSDLLQDMINAYDQKVELIRKLKALPGIVAAVKTVITMAWLPTCGELRSLSNSVHWEPMFILYCQRSVCEDYRLAGLINREATEVNDTIMVRDQFLEELDSLGVRHVKMAEFLRELQMRDTETMAKLQVLVAEMEMNACKKNEFIQKLKGLIPY
nr:hypothetical protein [Tanacetum cinerariifolium]